MNSDTGSPDGLSPGYCDPPGSMEDVSLSTAPGSSTAGGLPLIAYALPGKNQAPIVPASPPRAWMREVHKQFANRCLPLLIANQSGWFLLNPEPFRVTWDGNLGAGALKIEYVGGAPPVSAQFGHGVLTWHTGYLFRTPPGYNLAVGGPSNMPKDGIYALQGVVETDWAVAPFTMNWKFTRPNHSVTFEAGEPFCMIAPQRRHELEEFVPRIAPLEDEPELAAQWREFNDRRMLMQGVRQIAFNREGTAGGDRIPFERHYFEGTSPGGWSALEHQKKLSLRKFESAGSSSDGAPIGSPPEDPSDLES